MSASLQSRIQSEVEKFQTAIHKCLVPLQKTAYLCMAECSDPNQSPQSIERCYKKCQHAISSADNHVQFTVQNFQRGIQQCDMNCQDKTDQSQYEACVSACAEKVLHKFPAETDELISKLQATNSI
mmetsp:Transcript_59619/g.98391  ORF Transcript_59619/g.98391 Transcript_59619/m.98391 type:complete len:126 (+) Transcript_59619:1580-1957(+)